MILRTENLIFGIHYAVIQRFTDTFITMPRAKKDHLLNLISTLSKGEKRSFRIYAQRGNQNEDPLFVQLFNFLEKQKTYDENAILKKIPKLKKAQLSNIKAHLYQQILYVLRNLYKDKIGDIQIREQLDFAKILYSKGLYKQALSLIEKAKKGAIHGRQHALLMSVLTFERHIESQHITGSMYPKALEIKEMSESVVESMHNNNRLSNFSLMLYGLYLQFGYAKNKKDYQFLSSYFETNKPSVDLGKLDFYDKASLFQSYVWYYNMTQDFPSYYRYAQKWVDLFHEDPFRMYSDTSLFFKGLHNALNALFMTNRYDKFLTPYRELLSLESDAKLLNTDNKKSLYFLFKHIHGINEIFLTGNYEAGKIYIDKLTETVDKNQYNWDLNRIMVFYYKIGCVYFGSNSLEDAIHYLNKVSNDYVPGLRPDIQAFARILNLIAHFDLGNVVLVSYQVKSVYRFLLKLEDMGEVLKLIFKFLRRTPKMLESDLISEFSKLKNKLVLLQHDIYERRPFLYLDIISWLESKIEGIPIREVIRNKMGIEENIELSYGSFLN